MTPLTLSPDDLPEHNDSLYDFSETATMPKPKRSKRGLHTDTERAATVKGLIEGDPYEAAQLRELKKVVGTFNALKKHRDALAAKVKALEDQEARRKRASIAIEDDTATSLLEYDRSELKVLEHALSVYGPEMILALRTVRTEIEALLRAEHDPVHTGEAELILRDRRASA